MTERGPRDGIGGAPNPAGPSHSGDAPAPAAGPPADLAAVRRTDALVEALARRAPGPAARPAEDPDPAVRLLRALIVDVDEQAAGPAPPAPPAPSGPGPRRRGPRTIVALGVAGAVLASTGVAAAGGAADRSSAAPAPRAPEVSGGTDRPLTADVDAATLDRARPADPPAPERGAARPPSRDRERADIERLKRRLAHLFPPRTRGGPAGPPVVGTRSAPSDQPDGRPGGDPLRDDDLLRNLDGLRREAQKRADRAKNQRWDD